MFKPRGVRLPEFKEDNFTSGYQIDGDMIWIAEEGWIDMHELRVRNKGIFERIQSEKEKRPKKRRSMVR